MNTRCSTVYHMSLDAVIRFRCDPELEARFERVAALRRRRGSDLARIWFEDMVIAEEQRLGLVLSTSTLHDQFSSGPGLAAAKAAIVKSVHDEVSYKKKPGVPKKAPK